MQLTGRAHKAWGQLCSHHAAFTAAKVRRRAAAGQELHPFWPSAESSRSISTDCPDDASGVTASLSGKPSVALQ